MGERPDGVGARADRQSPEAFIPDSLDAVARRFEPFALCDFNDCGPLRKPGVANATFFAAVVLMSLSLASLVVEITISGGALRILLGQMEDKG